ncbi:MAG: type II secretion system F family protein [Defluviitaleaceae bacterium]|nr:type II secretion system F family protein [Defluviitaleaceae bacterium]
MPISPKRVRKHYVFAGKKKNLPLRDLAVFCRKLAFLLGAGIPIKTAMSGLIEQNPSKALGKVLPDIHRKIMEGVSFSGALKSAGVFPVFMCGNIVIGERTAKLPEVCARLADYYESLAQMKEEITAAMLYPAVVSLLMLAVIVMAVLFVLPSYSRVFEDSGATLPAFTIFLMTVSNFFIRNAFVSLLLILTVSTGTLFFFRSDKGRAVSSYIKLKIPLLQKNINLRLTQAMSMLLSSGLSVSETIPMCAEIIDNKTVRSDLEKLRASVDSGVSFWVALSRIPYVNPLLVGLARVGEDTGRLPQTLEKCNAYFEESYKHEIRRLNKLIEPVITLVLGAVLAAIMLAVILPTFELATAV